MNIYVCGAYGPRMGGIFIPIVNYAYIYTFIPLPEDFCGVDKTVDKYVPVDMNKRI